MECLHDWPGLLLKLRKIAFRLNDAMMLDHSTVATPALRLMRHLATNVARSAATAIECNFIVAALHVACLTTSPYDEDVVPDLPENHEALVSAYGTFFLNFTELSFTLFPLH